VVQAFCPLTRGKRLVDLLLKPMGNVHFDWIFLICPMIRVARHVLGALAQWDLLNMSHNSNPSRK